MEREAVVSKIVWGREGNPWKILRMSDGSSWKGDVGDVSPGMTLRAECGEPESNRYGLTYPVERLLGSAIEGEDAVEQWIAFRLPQVGPERARQIAETFGDSLWDVLLQAPERLTCIDGITTDRAAEIGQAYQKYQDEQRSVTRLLELGLRMDLAVKAHKYCAEVPMELEQLLQNDPYELDEVEGITFDVADGVAQRLEVRLDDPRRALAWTRSELRKDAQNGGHCYREYRDVAAGLLRFGLRGTAIRELIGNSDRLELSRDGSKVQLSRLARAEREVTRVAFELAAEGQRDAAVDAPDWLDDSQRAAVTGMAGSSIAVLTGGPGTGKTTCLKVVLDALESAGHEVGLCCPTGKAAKRLSEVVGRKASTVHRLLRANGRRSFEHHAGNPAPYSVIVCDEASMLDVELAAALFSAARGRLLLIGDVDQLPSVGPGQVLYDLIESGVVPVFRLNTTHRQKGESWVIDNAKEIINGRAPCLDETPDFDFIDGDTDDIISNAIELYRAESRFQVLTPEHKNGAGTVALNNALQHALNPASHDRYTDHIQTDNFKIYAGDKVLFTVNVPDLDLVNGDVGVVEQITVIDQKIRCTVQFDGHDVRHTLEGAHCRDLTLAYAMTVHKGQGSEWQFVAVVCDEAHKSLRRQLLYTAVTRTRGNLVLLGSREAVARAAARPRDTNRRTLLQQRLRGTE